MGFWDGSGISWTICKQSAPRSRQITTPKPHHSFFTGWILLLPPNQQCQSTEASVNCCIYLSTIVLQGCVASQSVTGWRLPHSNSTQITDGCRIGQLLCFRCRQKITCMLYILTLISPTLPMTTSPIYRQRQAGTEQSNVVACNCVNTAQWKHYAVCNNYEVSR